MVPTTNTWITINNIALSTSDRDILLSIVGYLNDRIMSAAQAILKQQSLFKGGFQDTTLGQPATFKLRQKSLLRFFLISRNHWLLSSTLGAKCDNEVYIYDSLHVCLNQAIKNQVAALLATKRMRSN